MSHEHIIINTLTGKVNCLRCGGIEEFNSKMPLPLKVVSCLLEEYKEQHKRCRPTDAGRKLKGENRRAWKEHLAQKEKEGGSSSNPK